MKVMPPGPHSGREFAGNLVRQCLVLRSSLDPLAIFGSARPSGKSKNVAGR
jgi:hypothetical protein